MHSTTHLLDCGWTFTQIGGGQGTEDGEWLETSAFPTSVHVELLHSKKIPDPFVGLHEGDVQCTPRRCLHASQVQLTLGLPT